MIVTPGTRNRRAVAQILSMAAVLGVAAAVMVLLLTACSSGSSSQVTTACAKAVQRQDAYARWADAQGYPDVPLAMFSAMNTADIALLRAMQKAGCPDNVRFWAMSSNAYDS